MVVGAVAEPVVEGDGYESWFDCGAVDSAVHSVVEAH